MIELDPMNMLPVDPEWLDRLHSIGELSAAALDCLVVTIAMQEQGKIAITVEGIPASGMLAEVAADLPQLLHTLGTMIGQQDKRGRENLNS